MPKFNVIAPVVASRQVGEILLLRGFQFFVTQIFAWIPRLNVCNVRAYVRLSTKNFFDFNEIWRVGRGRSVMHDGVQYDLIQGQGHESFKVGNPGHFQKYLLRHLQWELATDHWFLN